MKSLCGRFILFYVTDVSKQMWGGVPMMDSFNFSHCEKPLIKPRNDQQKVIPLSARFSFKVRMFDDVAKAAISELLSRQEVVHAMEKNWGKDMQIRKQVCEVQVSWYVV